MQSFPQTGDHGDRSNQSGYQHPILNVDAQDAETFNKRIQIGPAIADSKKDPAARRDAVKTTSALRPWSNQHERIQMGSPAARRKGARQ
jgi:hypothetical protein